MSVSCSGRGVVWRSITSEDSIEVKGGRRKRYHRDWYSTRLRTRKRLFVESSGGINLFLG